MNKVLERLLTVKSIVTLILTIIFAYLAVTGSISEEFRSIYLMIIAFYFGTQAEKNAQNG